MIVGIDPGVGGALAFHDPMRSVKSGLRWGIADMPVISDRGGHGELNPKPLRDLLRKWSPDRAVLEVAVTHPSDGRVGAFRYGGIYYAINAVLHCCDIPIDHIFPTQWKKFYGLIKADKEASRKKAIELFPEAEEWLHLKRHHGRAEAMLIANYGVHHAK